MTHSGAIIEPYQTFSMKEWAALRDGEPMTLSAADVERLHALNDPISLLEAENVYLPLARLLSLYVEAVQRLHEASNAFLGAKGQKVPFVIGVAGSVAVGKSTTSRILQALLQRWPSSPRVTLVTTDGFLFPNSVLEERGLMDRKGFPESFDRLHFISFLAAVKSGRKRVKAPVYSHFIYDVEPDKFIVVDQPDILIVEGLNILQPGALPKTGKPILFASDFLDFSVYIHAEETHLRKWFLERFKRLRDTAFRDPESFFHKFSKMAEKEAVALALDVWDTINKPNLEDNILPTRGRADLVLTKAEDHSIEMVQLKKL
jgi:type I pantothenate kinase